MVEGLKWFNVALALLGSLAAFAGVVKSNWRTTRPCIGAALLLIAAGLGAQWIGELRGDWMRVADTATFGGVLVLLIASQKVPTWFLERWANPAASVIAAAVAVVFLAVLLAPAAQAADTQEVEIRVPTLSADGAEICVRHGGCQLVTIRLLRHLIERAERADELEREKSERPRPQAGPLPTRGGEACK